MIGPGASLPALTMRTGGGGRLELLDARRNSVLLVVVDDTDCEDCRRWLRNLVGARQVLEDEEGEPILVVADDDAAKTLTDELQVPYTVLIDHDGALHDRLGVERGRAASVVADRYGEVWESREADCVADLPEPRRYSSLLRHIAIQCPECGFPDSPLGGFPPQPSP